MHLAALAVHCDQLFLECLRLFCSVQRIQRIEIRGDGNIFALNICMDIIRDRHQRAEALQIAAHVVTVQHKDMRAVLVDADAVLIVIIRHHAADLGLFLNDQDASAAVSELPGNDRAGKSASDDNRIIVTEADLILRDEHIVFLLRSPPEPACKIRSENTHCRTDRKPFLSASGIPCRSDRAHPC